MEKIQTEYTVTVSDFRQASYYGLFLRHRRPLQIMFAVLLAAALYGIGSSLGLGTPNPLVFLIAAAYLVPGLHGGHKLPLGVPLQRGDLHAAGKVVARHLHNVVQRALDAVIDAADKARPQLHAHGLAGRFYRGPGGKARSLLVYLYGGFVAVDLDDLADQTPFAYAHHVKHVGIAHALGDNERSGHFFDGAFTHVSRSPVSR